MHIPIPGVIDDPSARLHQPHDDPFDGPARVFAPQIEPANQMEQVVGEKAHLQPGFVRREPVATRFVQAQRVFAFLDPVFNLATPVVHLDHLARRKPGVGYNEIVPREKFSEMPLDLGGHPPQRSYLFSLHQLPLGLFQLPAHPLILTQVVQLPPHPFVLTRVSKDADATNLLASFRYNGGGEIHRHLLTAFAGKGDTAGI